MPPPSLDQQIGLREAVEDLAVQQFIAQRSVKALVIPVLPRRSRRDVERRHADPGQPFLHRRRDKFAAIVEPDIGGRPARFDIKARDAAIDRSCFDVVVQIGRDPRAGYVGWAVEMMALSD